MMQEDIRAPNMLAFGAHLVAGLGGWRIGLFFLITMRDVEL